MYKLIKRIMKWWSHNKWLKERNEHVVAILNYCVDHDCETCRFADAEFNCKIQERFED